MSIQPDIIGTIQKSTGKTLTDSEGFEYQETKAIPGYHVNFPEPLEGREYENFRVYPETPSRVYMDAPTYFYTFPGKAHFKKLFPDEPDNGDTV